MALIKRFLKETDGPRFIGQTSIKLLESLPPLATAGAKRAPQLRTNTLDPSSTISNHSSANPSDQSSPAIFSENYSSSSEASSAPSLGDDPLDQQLERMSRSSAQQGDELPCILNGVFYCDTVYPASRFEDWLSHSLAHYGGVGPPTHAICIFCHCIFESPNPLQCWRNRMQHIANHFEMGSSLKDSRPDFKVLEDMTNKGYLSRERYEECIGGTERPFIDGLRPADWEPEEVVEKKLAAKRAENRVVVTDSRHELRNRTRPTKGSGRLRRVEVKNPASRST